MEQTTSPHVDAPRKRDIHRRLTVLDETIRQSRGSRYLRRCNSTGDPAQSPKLADAINLPDWILQDKTQIDKIAAVTVLLHFRPVIDQIVAGETLRAICEWLGEEALDLACSAALPPEQLTTLPSASLPLAQDMISIGRNMLDRALPTAMAAKARAACGDEQMRHLSNMATALVSMSSGSRGLE